MLPFGVDHPFYCTAEVGNSGGTYELPCTFMIISHRILLRKETLSDKTCRENPNTYFIFNNLLSENRAVYETMWKNTLQPDSPQMTTQ
jgi:hypothetical protein